MNESCPTCNADLGPSTTWLWHHAAEDCRAIREPLPAALGPVHPGSGEECWTCNPPSEWVAMVGFRGPGR